MMPTTCDRTLSAFFASTLCLLLAACGGGGGGGSDVVRYTASAIADGGTIAPASRRVASDSATTFTLTPDAGYHIESVSGCGGSLSGNTYTTDVITADCTVSALFTADAFTFTNQGLNDDVTDVIRAADGSGDIYVVGGFTHYNDTTANGIIRLNIDGTVDTDTQFNTHIGSGFDGTPLTVAAAVDGSGDIYVGGAFTSYNGSASSHIVRLNSDGTVDTGFAVGSGFNQNVYTIAPADDGSGAIYVGGIFFTYNGAAVSLAMVRLDPYGSVDTGFAAGTGFSTNEVTIIVSAGDGSGAIYVGGNFTSYNGTAAKRLIRLNGDGTQDATFGVGSTGFDDRVSAIAVADDGSGDVYVGGWFSSYRGTACNKFVRLNGDASIDSGFDIGDGFNDPVLTIAMVGDGSGDLYVGGRFDSYNSSDANHLVRLQSTGAVNSNYLFGSGFDDNTSAIVPVGDGTGAIYVGGVFNRYNGSASPGLIRLAGDGAVSLAYADHVAFNDEVDAIVPAADGSGDIYVAGMHDVYDTSDSGSFLRLNSDGTVDTGFVTGSGFDDDTYTVAMANDGSGDLYVGGSFSDYNGTASEYLVRLNSDGTVDTDYGSQLDSDVYTVAPAIDGSGGVYVGGDMSHYIARLNRYGSLDSDFVQGGGFDSTVYAIVPLQDGSGDIYVAGDFTSYGGTTANQVVRLHSDGTLDTGFDSVDGFNGGVYALALANDGSGDIFVGGYFHDFNGTAVGRIVRLNSDGSLDTDTDFNTNAGSGFDYDVYAITVDADGAGLYVGGYFSSFNGNANNGLIRLNSDGTIDSGFALGDGFDSYVKTIVTGADDSGALYVGGNFSAYQGTTVRRIISLNPDGSVD